MGTTNSHARSCCPIPPWGECRTKDSPRSTLSPNPPFPRSRISTETTKTAKPSSRFFAPFMVFSFSFPGERNGSSSPPLPHPRIEMKFGEPKPHWFLGVWFSFVRVGFPLLQWAISHWSLSLSWPSELFELNRLLV